jgi:hypothetical protein
VLLIAIAIALAVVGIIVSGDVGGGGGEAVAKGAEIPIKSATDFDPEGTEGEHPDEVELAIDGNPTGSAWTTETYTSGPAVSISGKSGVGLYLDAGKPVRARKIEVRSPDPGWDAEIGAANEPPPDEFSGWQLVGGAEDIAKRETISIDTRGRRYRYYLIWITELAEVSEGYRVEISDARLFS